MVGHFLALMDVSISVLVAFGVVQVVLTWVRDPVIPIKVSNSSANVVDAFLKHFLAVVLITYDAASISLTVPELQHY